MRLNWGKNKTMSDGNITTVIKALKNLLLLKKLLMQKIATKYNSKNSNLKQKIVQVFEKLVGAAKVRRQLSQAVIEFVSKHFLSPPWRGTGWTRTESIPEVPGLELRPSRFRRWGPTRPSSCPGSGSKGRESNLRSVSGRHLDCHDYHVKYL